MCKSAILYSKNDYALGDSLRFICRSQKVNLIYSLNFSEVLHHAINVSPEVVFYDEDTVGFNEELYKDFMHTKVFHMPKIVVITSNPQRRALTQYGVEVLDKKCFADEVSNILSTLNEKSMPKLTTEKIEEYRTKVAKLLGEFGVTTKYLGYEYIKELVVFIIKDKRMLKSFNTKLYPKLAIKYNTQVNNIERNIRNAIGVAMAKCKNRMLFDEVCGRANLHVSNPIPSNKQFITWLVDKVS